jgi:DNA-binding NarL/FixJ family response regulator
MTHISRSLDHAAAAPDDVRQQMPAAIRVYLLSDVRLYREGLLASLGSQPRLTVVGASGSQDFMERIAVLRPEVMLLDLAACDSLTIPRRARDVLPALRVVAFAVAEMEENLLACAEAGITGYVAQDGSAEDLVTAVLRALRGELVCPPRITAFLFSRMAALSSGRPPVPAATPLTPREQEIASLITCNMSNKQIARHLRLGPTTVKNHVHNILQKLNVRRRADVARLRSGASAVPPPTRSLPVRAPQIEAASPAFCRI